MQATSLVALPSFTAPSLFPPVLRPKTISHSGLLSLTVNHQRCNIGINKKILSFCPKASLRGNLEATGVPTSVPVRVAHKLLQAGHRYLDVRLLKNSVLDMPLGLSMSLICTKLDQGCQLGKRSLIAATVFLAAGFTSVTDIAGGYVAWTQNGLPAEP